MCNRNHLKGTHKWRKQEFGTRANEEKIIPQESHSNPGSLLGIHKMWN